MMQEENYGDFKEVNIETLKSYSGTLLETSSFYAIENKLMKIKQGTIDQTNYKPKFIVQSSQPVKVPTHPPDVNIDENITKSRGSFNPYWFIEKVKL